MANRSVGAKKTARKSVSAAQQAVKTAKAARANRTAVQATREAVRTAVSAVKGIIAGTKALAAAIAAGGWVSVLVVVVVCLIGLFVGSSYGIAATDGQIIAVARSQIGNVGGQPYWSWYGYANRVAWCACFVSWCANECGYIEAGIIPKFASCANGVLWFKSHGQWADASIEPAPGMLIFFDWNRDGHSDHVGIVEKCENGIVHTIEGNTSDSCRERSYAVGHYQIMGYGVPAY